MTPSDKCSTSSYFHSDPGILHPPLCDKSVKRAGNTIKKKLKFLIYFVVLPLSFFAVLFFFEQQLEILGARFLAWILSPPYKLVLDLISYLVIAGLVVELRRLQRLVAQIQKQLR